jgi:hypothetical protein
MWSTRSAYAKQDVSRGYVVKRIFVTTDEQDAALARRAKLLGIDETELVAALAGGSVAAVLKAYRDAEAAQLYEAFRSANESQRTAVKDVLGLTREREGH